MTELRDLYREDGSMDFDSSKSMYIEASAGTGKTYTIEQIVERLIREGAPIEKILIVTYTEKATCELKDRIRKKLMKAVREESSSDAADGEGRLKEALRNADNAQIYTIHSFCQKVMKEYAYEIHRPFEMEMVDDADVEKLVSQWVRDRWPSLRTYRDLIVSPAGDSNNKEASGIDKYIRSLTQKLCGAIEKYYLDSNGDENPDIVRFSKEYTLGGNRVDFDKLIPLSFEKLKKYHPGVREHYERLEQYRSEKMTGSKTVQAFLDDLNKWGSHGGQLKNTDLFSGGSFKTNNVKKDIPDIYAVFEFFYNFKKELENIIAAINEYQNNAFLYSCVRDLYLAWRQMKLEQKWASYNDMIQVVHQEIVEGNEDFIRSLREAYSYAIIDEFQDTNRIQWDIFKTIFLNVDKHHAIFVVGDPKQSIFSFQGTDINVYRSAIGEIGNGRRLVRNYRSTNAMIDACNQLFSNDAFFNYNGISFEPSGYPDAKKMKREPEINGAVCSTPVWVPERAVSVEEFAEMAVQKIVDWCSYENEHTRLQIFDKEHCNQLRDVTFRDIAILARTRPEMDMIEEKLQDAGIPFLRYKDKTLFSGRECLAWKALFSAIDTADFSAKKRSILNEALLTDFFPNRSGGIGTKLETVDNGYYDSPLCEERTLILRWHKLARMRRWSELQECIYSDSGIESRLSADLSRLQDLAKIHQIGNYCVDYLYKHQCTLKDLVKHLDRLNQQNEKNEEQDGNLVAKDTDLKAVQIMTIHASKGLEYPVVIAVGGHKGRNPILPGPYTYHDKDGYKYLGFLKQEKIFQQQEEDEEWQRLFYVAYTRATSLLVLPIYNNWNDKDFSYLKTSIEALALKPVCEKMSLDKVSPEVMRNKVRDILQVYSEDSSKQQLEECCVEEQLRNIQKLQKKIGGLSLMQHSYSSLTGKLKHASVEDTTPEIESEQAGRLDKSGEVAQDGDSNWIQDFKIDNQSKQVKHEEKYNQKPSGYEGIAERCHYPAGTQLGNAVHEIFESLIFNDYKDLPDGFNDVNADILPAALNESITIHFEKFGFAISAHDDWREVTARIVWNTLHAHLPEIVGSSDTGKVFSLWELPPDAHFPEMEFMLHREASDGESARTGEHFCKGYIDLVFVLGNPGEERYAILDWKTDYMAEEDYANADRLKEKVDREYAVQRVLYSYTLIQWLKSFSMYSGMTEAEIFDKHFGGIYYAFVRGCRAGTSNGIYAQTWDSFATLEDRYNYIRGNNKYRGLMFASKKGEEKENG